MASGDSDMLLIDAVYGRLRDMIVSNALQAGQKLVERDLASQLGVSRTPVRGALGLLSMAGLVENRIRRGYYVSKLSAEQVSDLYEFRKILEMSAAGLAAQRADVSHLHEIDCILDELQTLTPELENHARAVQLDMKIHELIARASGVKLLHQAIKAVLDKVMCFISVEIGDRESLVAAHVQHKELLRAIQERNVKAAVDLVRQHIEGAQSSLLEVLHARERLQNAVLAAGRAKVRNATEHDTEKETQQGVLT